MTENADAVNHLADARQVTVIGLGLIGGSLVKALVTAGIDVVGWDLDEDTRQQARAAGVHVPDDLVDVFRSATELVVLAVPLRAMATVVAQASGLIEPHVTITDVGSVKRQVRDTLRQAGLAAQYVGAHPMAGTELSGFAAADAELLTNITWALTIDPGDQDRHVIRVMRFITEVMRSRALVLDDEDHDRAVARVSHLPHILATELLALAQDSAPAMQLAAGSFRDGTRVARHGWERSQAMVEANSQACIELIELVRDDLTRLAQDLAEGRNTQWFFMRHRAADVVGMPVDEARQLTWDDAWRAQVLAAGKDGWVVTSVGDDGCTLRRR